MVGCGEMLCVLLTKLLLMLLLMMLFGTIPKTEQGFRYIMVIEDYFSKWV